MQRHGEHAPTLLHEAINERDEPHGGDGDFVGPQEELSFLFGKDGEGLRRRGMGWDGMGGRGWEIDLFCILQLLY
jgi:hypothetical protein